MIRHLLIASAATLALTAPLAAQGGGNKDKGGQAAKAERGGGGGQKAERRGGGGQKAERRAGGGERKAARVEHGGHDRKQARAERRNVDRGSFRMARAERGNDRKRSEVKVRGRSDDRIERKANRIERAEKRIDRKVERVERNALRVRNDDRRQAFRGDNNVVRVRGFDNDDRWVTRFANGQWEGCPPGHAKTPGFCMPPGQLKKMQGTVLPAALKSSMLPMALRDVWQDDDDYIYRYNDGYLYRVDRDTSLIASLLPLFGGGLGVGQVFPTSYSSFAMPSYYQPFYQDTSDDYYRYANGYMYEIDRDNGLIEDIIPLYDQGYGVGQMLPPAYSYYNLPYQYRSAYVDSDDYYYRYAPGAIYQVDQDTSLITAIASLLVPGLGVGQQLPLGYDTYNVPYQYRAQYYDTPDAWYRYGNGNIYQVDPTTRLITAVIDAIV